LDPLVKKLQAHGLSGKALQTAWLIAMRESGGRSSATNPDRSTGDDSYGLFQINMLGNLGPARRKQYGLKSNSELLNADTNIEAAKKLSKNWTDFGAWGIGPNAYRKMAPLDYGKFPNKDKLVYSARRLQERRRREDSTPSSPIYGEDSSLAGIDSQRKAAAGYFRASAAAILNDQPMPSLMALSSELRTIRQTTGMVVPEISEGHDTDPSVEKTNPARAGSNYIDTDGSWKGTHVTDGLDWNNGQKTARDIMGAAGTPVGAPEDGVIVKWGSAQGGEALYFKGKSGKMYWLGHIDKRSPVGTKALQDNIIARIANQKVSAPHVHEDVHSGGWQGL